MDGVGDPTPPPIFFGGVGEGIHTLTVDVRRGRNTSSFPSSNAIIHIQKSTVMREKMTCAKKYQHAMLKWHWSESEAML